jgi:ribonuclease PH
VGKVDGEVLLDLNYEEDSKAEVDMNIVMTGSGKFVEIQGTAEGGVFTKKEMDGLVKIAQSGIKILTRIQKKSLHPFPLPPLETMSHRGPNGRDSLVPKS